MNLVAGSATLLFATQLPQCPGNTNWHLLGKPKNINWQFIQCQSLCFSKIITSVYKNNQDFLQKTDGNIFEILSNICILMYFRCRSEMVWCIFPGRYIRRINVPSTQSQTQIWTSPKTDLTWGGNSIYYWKERLTVIGYQKTWCHSILQSG